jgi:hypothetical protein
MSDDEKASTLWIDVSHHDRNRRGAPLDWNAIRAATSPVMCARAWYGDPAGYHNSSPYWAEHQQGAKAAGFVARGGYMDLIHGDQASINRQVELAAQGSNWAMADIEPYAELVSNNLWPRPDDVHRLNDRWAAVEPGWPLLGYIPQWFWADHRDGSPSLRSMDLRFWAGPLIQSHYIAGNGRGPRELYAAAGGNAGTGWDDLLGGRYPDGWQYSSTCTCPGATDRTDVNAFRGSLDQLVALLTGGDLDMSFDDDDKNRVRNGELILSAILQDLPEVTGLLGDPTGTGMRPNKLHERLNELAAPTVDVDALAAKLGAALGGSIEAAAERAVRKVLGAVDGATPQG